MRRITTLAAAAATITTLAACGSSFDPEAATDDAKYDHYVDLVEAAGYEPSLDRSEAADVGNEFCDNDLGDMQMYAGVMFTIQEPAETEAEMTAKAASFCPANVVDLVDEALGTVGEGGLAAAAAIAGELSGDGVSIRFDTKGEEQYGSNYDDYVEVVVALEVLNVPDHVMDRVQGTRALDGTLEARWTAEGDVEYEAFWRYHPDDGLGMTVYTVEA